VSWRSCALLPLALLIPWSACSGGAVLDISVSGLLPDTRSLEVRPSLDHEAATGSPFIITHRLENFFLRLPANASGALKLHIAGREDSGCATAAGDAALEVMDGQSYQVEVALAPLAQKGCRIELAKGGEATGSVQVTGGANMFCGTDCTQLDIVGLPTDTMTLSATSAANANFSGWNGACRGRGDCVVTIASEPLPVIANFIAPRLCTSQRWCWENPLPAGMELSLIRGFAQDDVWALVGESSNGSGLPTLHWNGAVFSVAIVDQPSLAIPTLHDLWKIPDTHYVYAVGENFGPGIMMLWDGSQWFQIQTTPAGLNAIWGADGQNLWAVGVGGAIFRTDPTAMETEFVPVSSPIKTALNGLWGSSANSVLAVGDGGTALKWDGTAWTPQASGTTANLKHIWGAGSSFAVAVGDKGTLIEWNGTSFRKIDLGITDDLNDVWGSDPGNVFAVGAKGTLLRRQAGTWKSVPIDTKGELSSVWVRSAQDAWIVDYDGEIFRFDGQSWKPISKHLPLVNFRDVWGSDPSDVYAVGASDTDTKGAIVHWDGGSWNVMATSDSLSPLTGIWGSAADDIWAVGAQGTVAHWDGQQWSRTPFPAMDNLTSIFGTDVRHLWATSDSGTIWAGDGRQWTAAFRDPSLSLHRLWAASASNIWAVGQAPMSSGAVVSYNGVSWQRERIPAVDELNAIWASGPRDVWAGGIGLELVHWDGTSWRLDDLHSGATIFGLWGKGPGDVLLVGNFSTIRRFQDNAWGPELKTWTADDLHGIWGQGDDIFAVGQNGTILRYRP